MEAAVWLEGTGLAAALRHGLWLYPIVNVAHVLGVALLFGAIAVLDLRLAGLWRGVPVAALARPTLPLAIAGFALAAVSGVGLLSVEAVDYAANPFLYVKFGAIALAGLNALTLHRSADWRARDETPSRRLVAAGVLSFLCWLVALSAGRLIAYW